MVASHWWVQYIDITADLSLALPPPPPPPPPCRFPNQYCAATPALQYSDDKLNWKTKWRLECAAACPNNATAAEAQAPSSWTLSPKDPGSVAPPGAQPQQHGK